MNTYLVPHGDSFFLLYLPRIFVYHSEADHDSQKRVFKTMERKLYNFIMMPAMLLSWLFGMLLIHSLGFSVFSELWMQLKTALVVLLTFTIFTWKIFGRICTDNNTKPSRYFRIINEVPTIILIVVVFLVIFKPL